MNIDKLVEEIQKYDDDNNILSGGANEEDVKKFAEHLVNNLSLQHVSKKWYPTPTEEMVVEGEAKWIGIKKCGSIIDLETCEEIELEGIKINSSC